MRKLLFLVLIAIAFCAVVEANDADVEAWSLKSVWDKVKNFASKAVNFLKQTGIWGVIKNLLGTAGAAAAGAGCQSFGVPAAICSTMVKIVANNM